MSRTDHYYNTIPITPINPRKCSRITWYINLNECFPNAIVQEPKIKFAQLRIFILNLMIPLITVLKLIIRQLYKLILRAIHAWHVYWQQTAATQLLWSTISHSITEFIRKETFLSRTENSSTIAYSWSFLGD